MFTMQPRYRLRGSHGPTESTVQASPTAQLGTPLLRAVEAYGTPGSDAKRKQNQLPNPTMFDYQRVLKGTVMAI